jgi:hypothetical protein
MAKIGSYGWSPKQMERINARRAARGREQLINLRNIETEEDLQKAQNLVASSKDTRKPVTMQAKAGATDMGKEAEERTKKFREKFKPKGSMAAEYGYKSSFPTPISKGLREAAGKPLIRKSWDEMNV